MDNKQVDTLRRETQGRTADQHLESKQARELTIGTISMKTKVSAFRRSSEHSLCLVSADRRRGR